MFSATHCSSVACRTTGSIARRHYATSSQDARQGLRSYLFQQMTTAFSQNTHLLEKLHHPYRTRIPKTLPFPRHNPEKGNHYHLSKSLEQVGFVPFHQAFHNPSVKVLLGRNHGQVTMIDKSGSQDANESSTLNQDKDQVKTIGVDVGSPIITTQGDSAPIQRFISQNSQIVFKDSHQKPYAQFISNKYVKRLGKEIKYYMEHVPYSFTHDGCVGSHPKQSTMTRVFTDNAASSLFLRHMILKSKIAQPLESHTFDSFIVHAPGYYFTPEHIREEFAGPKPKDLNLEHETFLLTDEEIGSSTLAACDDSMTLLDVLAYHASQDLYETNGSLLLPADTISHKGKHTLVFGNDNDTGSLYDNLDALYSAHHSVLNSDGTLSRAWNGFVKPVPKGKVPSTHEDYALLEKLPDGSQRITQTIPGIVPNVIDKPSSIVFLVNDKNNGIPSLARVKPEQALDLLVSGLHSITDAPHFRPGLALKQFSGFIPKKVLREKLRNLLFPDDENAQVDFYIANSALPEVDKAIHLVAEDQLSDLKGRAVAGTQDAVRNISHKDLPTAKKGSKAYDVSSLLELAKKEASD